MQLAEKRTLHRVAIALVLCFFLAAPPRLPAQSPGPPSGSDEDVTQAVARICYLDGSVSYARGDDPDNWQAADYNVPMTIGDRLYTGNDGRAELEVHGGFAVRVGAQADLEAINLTDDTKQWSLRAGDAAFQLKQLDENEVFEVDTPNSAITFERTGQYRVDVDNDGNTRVAVQNGRALVAAGGGQVAVGGGQQMNIEGGEAPQYDVVAIRPADSFDRWVSERERRESGARSNQYVHADVVGAADLDQAGTWQSIPSYGYVWSPSGVEVGWQPYRAGHWIWQDPWGWTWVSTERWGWAPYHYGRWITWSGRWWWVPVARSVRVVRYAPALVAFCGGGPGWSVSVTAPGGYIGWFPLAPRDPFVHWWGARRAYAAANVTYVNRGYITVINQRTFVSGGLVTTGWVRDRAVVAQVSAAPVLRGPIPFVPLPGALHVAARSGLPPVMRPPQVVATRAVVVRTAPPPPPPVFSTKVAVIEKNNGAPVDRRTAVQIVETNKSAGRPVAPYRPAVAETGRVTLAPRGGAQAQVPKAEPVTETFRGRPVATTSNTQPGGGPQTGTATTNDRGRRTDAGGRNRGPDANANTSTSVRPTPPPKASDGTYDRGRRTDTGTPQKQPTAVPERGRRTDTGPPQRQVSPPPERNVRPTPVPQGDRGGHERNVRPTPVPQQDRGGQERNVKPTPVPQPARQAEPARRAVEPPPPRPQTGTPQGQGQGQDQGQGQKQGGGKDKEKKEKPPEKKKDEKDKKDKDKNPQ